MLAIGKSIEQREDKPVEVPTVTLLVSPDEAEKLTLAARYEPVRLALRNYGDATVVGTPGRLDRRRCSRPLRPAAGAGGAAGGTAAARSPAQSERSPGTPSRCCSARRSRGRISVSE